MECAELCVYVAVGLLLANVVLLFAAVLKYHVWSIMQARLLFPSMMGIIGAFGAGVEIVCRKARASSALNTSIILMGVLFGLYLSSEIARQIVLNFGLAAFLIPFFHSSSGRSLG